MGGMSRRKAEKRLRMRLKAFDSHGPHPTGINSPGKQQGGMEMHRPGSMQGR